MKSTILFLFIILLLASSIGIVSGQTDSSVGAISGTLDVTTTGAATYSIPIDAVPGTNGIEPNISIVYNSQSGIGLLGSNWQLEGLSSIRRIPQSMYQDNNITQVNLNLTDRYELDGNRLVEVLGTYGHDGTKYRTEIESFKEVTSKGNGTGGPNYFEVVDDNGTIYEYGKETNSLQMIGGVPFAWYISKITDCEGNYINYTYSSYLGQVVITEIEYTGNAGAGLEPYAKMIFTYTDDNVFKTGYIRGHSYISSKLLQDISIYCKGYLVKKYSLTYDYTRFPRLTNIVLSGENDKQLNPTIIKWGESMAEITTYQTDVEGLGYYPFRYDGDKCTDFFFCPGTTGDWRVIVNDCNGNLGWEMYGHIDYYDHSFPADINGDGLDEIVYGRNDPGNTVSYHYILFDIEAFDFEEVDMNISFNKNELSQMLPGDLNGDGKDEILFYTPTKYPKLTFWGLNDGVSHNNDITLSAEQLMVQDNNNDRKAEIMVGMPASIIMYEYDDVIKRFVAIVSDNNVRMSNYNYYGDFNDDGLKDVLVVTSDPNGNYSCSVKINENSTSWMWSSFGTSIPLELTFYYQNLQTPPMIGDMNGDKKDDIVVTVLQPDNKVRLDIYYSDGYKNNQLQYHKVSSVVESLLVPNYSSPNYYFCTDMNGDGTSDILYMLSNDSKIVLFFYKDEQFELMKEITDGLGATNTLNYIMSNSPHNYYTSNNESRIYFPLTTDIYTSNGLANDMTKKSYTYLEVLYSLNRSKFYGFETIKSTNNTTGLEITSKYAMNTSFDNVDIVRRDFYQGKFIKNETFVPAYISWGKRFYSYNNIYEIQDLLSGVITKTSTDVYTTDGRIKNRATKNSRIYNNIFLSSSNSEYRYKEVVLPNFKTTMKIDSIIKTEMIAGATESLIYTTTNSYLNGRLENIVSSNSSSTVKTTYSLYNSFGNPRNITRSASGVMSQTDQFEYDPTGRFTIVHTNALGQISNYSYYASTGNIETFSDINGLITYYYYDEFGRERLRQNPNGTSDSTSRQWNSCSWFPGAVYVVVTKTTASPTIEVYYDKLNREVFSSVAGVGYTQTIYNDKGQIIKISRPYLTPSTLDENKIWTIFTYYTDGRIETEVGPYLNMKYTYEGADSEKSIVTVTDQLRNTIVKKYYDLPDRIRQVQDFGGILTYDYDYKKVDNNQVKVQTITYETNVVTLAQDLNDNLVLFNDPNSGTIKNTYDAFNRMITKSDANGNRTTYQYDQLNRVISENHCGGIESDRNYVYIYDLAPGNAIGELYYKTINGVLDEMYYYDDLNRVKTRRKVINGSMYEEFFEYNNIGQLSTYRFPDNFKIKYEYNSYGELSKISDDANNSLICEINRNRFRKHSKLIYGNESGVRYVYNSFGRLTNIYSGNLGNGIIPDETIGDEIGTGTSTYSVGDQYRALTYTINTKGLIEKREDTRLNQYEKYTYDNLDRLTSYSIGTINPLTSSDLNYDINSIGNITSSTNIGRYIYYGGKPYQTGVVLPNSNCNISQATCDVTYNNLNLPSSINEGIYSYTIEYGADGFRRKSNLTKTEDNESTMFKTTLYISPTSEVEITSSGTKSIDYIMTDQGIAAIRTKRAEQINMYYIHTDHLGSYNFVMDANKNIVQSCHFDPWGNRKLYNNWSQDNTATSFLFSRGYTSHEHLDAFKIINMNARLYDPMIGRFFSPDPVIKDYEFTQCYNRYSYCRNNPIMNIDPTGLNSTGYTIDEEGNIEKVNDVGGDKYDVLYKKSEYNEKMKYDGDFTGNRTGLIILDKKIINELKYQLGSSVYYENGSPEFRVWYEGHRSFMYDRLRYTESASKFDIFNVFKFVADNTKVEWAISGFKIDGNSYWALGTAQSKTSAVTWHYIQPGRYVSSAEFFNMHNHCNGALLGASGKYGDQYLYKNNPGIPHYIYNVTNKSRFQYNDKSIYFNPIMINSSNDLYK